MPRRKTTTIAGGQQDGAQPAAEDEPQTLADKEPPIAEKLSELGERNSRIAEMRRKGKSLEAIADAFGLSSTRVHRILAATGVTPPTKPKAAKKARAKKK